MKMIKYAENRYIRADRIIRITAYGNKAFIYYQLADKEEELPTDTTVEDIRKQMEAIGEKNE
jgi:predicted patatin/cPLA2 family phospholipase